MGWSGVKAADKLGPNIRPTGRRALKAPRAALRAPQRLGQRDDPARPGRLSGHPYLRAVKLQPTPDDGLVEPTPGERLLHALGQIHRRWHAGTGRTPPHEVDIEALARTLGAWAAVEFVQDGDGEQRLHFPDEILIIDHRHSFPWRLLGTWEWAREQEVGEFWRYLD